VWKDIPQSSGLETRSRCNNENMSGFFGIFNQEGIVDAVQSFKEFQQHIDTPHHHGVETFIGQYFAVCQVGFKKPFERGAQEMSMISDCGNFILAGHLRLDYRDELGDKLGLVQNELDKCSDASLVLLAYKKWKKKAVFHLEGDWCILVIVQSRWWKYFIQYLS
jgi:hypothetical protein